MRKLFGTDGIRGVAGDFPLDAGTVFIIGKALGHRLAKKEKQPRVVIGQDTRHSGAWIADTVAAALVECGVAVESAGVVTTPAVAYLARSRKLAAGVVISASHNPWTDNGIKVFGGDGYKLPDAVELEIEQEIFHLLEKSEKSKAAAPLPPAVTLPDGQNINQNCGALHPEVVAGAVLEKKAGLGITFDGDADRALFADAQGNVVNGDAVLLLTARDMKARGALPGDTVVATTMSNMGLEAALKRSGIRMLRAPVGDKYVLDEMRKCGSTLGGEQSGHIIFADQATTGDGLLTALRVLDVMARSGKPLAELVADLKVFPQVIKNVRVREKRPLEEIPEVARAMRDAEGKLGGNGRVVVRYSGTEPLARVMVEAESEAEMRRHADAIAAAIQKALGA